MKNAVWVNLPYDAKHLGCIADPSRPGIGSESGGMGTEGIMTLITSEPPQLRRAIYLQLYEPPSVFNYSSIMHKQIPFVKTSALQVRTEFSLTTGPLPPRCYSVCLKMYMDP